MVKALDRFQEWLWSGPKSAPSDNSLASLGGMRRSWTFPGRQLHKTDLFWMMREFKCMDTGYSALVGLTARAFSGAG